jgi:transcriptional regulator with XRE-family HTH domain
MTQHGPDYATRLALSIAAEVRRHRLAKGLSAQQLAERCDRIGMPIKRSVIANLESGRRTTVTVAEVLVLAQALEVPPAVLLFPVGYATEVEVLPEAVIEPLEAIGWVAGTVAISEGEVESATESPLSLARRHQDYVALLLRSMAMRERALENVEGIPERYRQGEVDMQKAQSEYRRLQEQLVTLVAVEADAARRHELNAVNARMAELSVAMESFQQAKRKYDRLKMLLENADRSVLTYEGDVRSVREAMKRQGLIPPRLPASLSHIDPGASVKSEDSRPIYSLSWGEDGELQKKPVIEEAEAAPRMSESSHRQLQETIDEMKPYLVDAIREAMQHAMRRDEGE